MSDLQQEKMESAGVCACSDCAAPAAVEEKICCTRCATEISGVNAVCPACGFVWDEERKQKITNYFYIYCIGLAITFLNQLFQLVLHGRPLLILVGNILTASVNLIVLVFTMMFLYQCWCLIPKKDRFAWPGQYVGFLFVPFYQFYWMFPAYYGLIKRQNVLLPEEKRGNKGIVLAFLVIPYVFVTVICVISAVVAILSAMKGGLSPNFFQSVQMQWMTSVVYGIPMLVISFLTMFQFKKCACNLIELPPEEKSRIMKSVPGAPGAKKIALWPVWTSGGCGCLLIILVIAALIGSLVFLASGRDKARQILCVNNMKQLGAALHMYAADNDGQYPPYNGEKGLRFLYNGKYIPSDEILSCPSNGTEKYFYIYLGGLNGSVDPDTVIVFCEECGKKNRWFTVLCVDGAVRRGMVPGKTGYAELFRKYGILDEKNQFTEKGRKLPPATREYILQLLREKR